MNARSNASRWRLVLLCLTLIAVVWDPSVARSEERIYSQEDFAHGRSIEVVQSGALQTVLLDIHVYRGLAEPGLADMRVYDAEGAPVPYAVRRFQPQDSKEQLTEPLPLFRLERRRGDADGSGRGYELDGASFRIEADVEGRRASIHLEPVTAGATQELSPAVLEGYLIELDPENLERDVVGLELTLQPSEADYLVALRVEGSGDLVDFQELNPRGAIAHMEQSGFRIERTRVEVRAFRDRFLRITWPGAALPVAVTSVRAYLAPTRATAARMHADLEPTPSEDEPGVFLFDAGGEVPIDRVQVELPRGKRLVSADLYSADAVDGPWWPHFSGLLYDLEAGGPLRNPAITWPVQRRRYLKLAVSDKGGGVGSGMPALDVAWRPEQLLFVAGGAAPFHLAYGRAGVADGTLDSGSLTGVVRQGERALPAETAKLGRPRRVAPTSVLEPVREPIPGRTLLLWGVLVVAVLAVVGMSLHLLRDMQGAPDGNAD